MVFGIGAAIKTVFKIRENKAKVGKLETLVAQLEHQQREPFFNVLSGIERFDTLLPLLDAAFAQKVKAVAKEELQKTPASRAEVAALGLALREVSVTLDKEIGSLRDKGEETFKRQASRYGTLEEDLRKRVENDHEGHQREISSHLTREFSRQSAYIETKANENRDTLLSELKKGVADVNSRTQSLVQENHKALSLELCALLEAARKDLKAEVEARFDRFSIEMGRRLDETNALQTKALEQMNHQVHTMANEQALFAQIIGQQMQQTRNKVLLLASSALILVAIHLLLYLMNA